MKNEEGIIFAIIAAGVAAKILHILIMKYYSDFKQKKENELFEEMHPIQVPKTTEFEIEESDILISLKSLIYDDDPEYANAQREFIAISKQEFCIAYDREEIDSMEDYANLLAKLLELAKSHFDGKVISSTDGDIWQFKLKINENQEIMSFDHQYLSWLNDSFITALNKIICKYCEGSYQFIEMGGQGTESKYADQGFCICYLPSIAIDELSKSKRKFILPPNSSFDDGTNRASEIIEFDAPIWFPCQVVKVTNIGYDDALNQAKSKYQNTVPIVIGGGENLFDDWEQQITERQHGYNEIIERSDAQYSALIENYTESAPAEHEFNYPSIDKTLAYDIHESTYFIALVPVEYNWQALAYLNFGEWNECPSCEYCAALMRVWEERNGIIAWYIKPDTIRVILPEDATINNIEQSSKDAIIWNSEHFELLSEGVPSEQSLQKMKLELTTNKNITFWWD